MGCFLSLVASYEAGRMVIIPQTSEELQEGVLGMKCAFNFFLQPFIEIVFTTLNTLNHEGQ